MTDQCEGVFFNVVLVLFEVKDKMVEMSFNKIPVHQSKPVCIYGMRRHGMGIRSVLPYITGEFHLERES